MALAVKTPQMGVIDYIDLLRIANELDVNVGLTGCERSIGAYAALAAMARAPESADEFFELYSEELNKMQGRKH